ncbi:MAG: hypothetical protein JJ895_10570 [Balneolaceae bacterium]|nr:hypothetical protein [Balneolaceae bacterium]
MTNFKKTLLHLHAILLICFLSGDVANAQSGDSVADSGWVQINTNLDEFYVVVDEDFYNPYKLENNEAILLPTGSYSIRLVWNTINDWRTRVTILPGDTVQTGITFSFRNRDQYRSSYNAILYQNNLQLRGTADNMFRINGELIPTNYADTLLAPGMYEIEIGKGKKWQGKDVMISPGTFTEFSYEMAEIHPKNKGFYFIPGAGYWHHRKKFKSVLTISALAILTSPLINEIETFGNAKSSFENWESRYNDTENTLQAIEYRENADAQRDIMLDARKSALLYSAGIALVYGFTVWDSMNIGTTRYYRTKVKTSLVSTGFEGTLYPTLVLTHEF